MYAQLDKSKENKRRSVANSVTMKKNSVKEDTGFVNNRPRTIVQRTVKIVEGDINVTGPNLITYAKEGREMQILGNWVWSKTRHEFTNEEKLRKAIKMAKESPDNKPNLYKKENLKFLTKAKDRAPTLYFKDGDNSGRMRQQHGSGPMQKSQTGKEDYFFDTKETAASFKRTASNNKADEKEFVPSNAVSTTPENGQYHVEITYRKPTKEKPTNIEKTHISGGQISINLDDYDEQSTTKIYEQVTGRATR